MDTISFREIPIPFARDIARKVTYQNSGAFRKEVWKKNIILLKSLQPLTGKHRQNTGRAKKSDP